MSARLHVAIERLSAVLREELRELATGAGLALAQLEALHALAVLNRFSDTPGSVARFLGTTAGTTGQTLAALERKALVERARDAADARVHHVRLTDAGRALVAQTLPAPSLRDLAPSDAAEPIEALLRALLVRRGGRPFGVCATCVHHRVAGAERRCALLDVALTDDDASRLCREHVDP